MSKAHILVDLSNIQKIADAGCRDVLEVDCMAIKLSRLKNLLINTD